MRIQFSNQQQQSINKLFTKQKALLTEPCGSGKTLIALEAARRTNLPVYVVCPANVIPHWQAEATKLGMTIKVASWNKIVDINLEWYKLPVGVLIVDEAHFLSGTGARSKAVIRQSKRHPYRFLVTATPLVHRPVDLYWPLKLCGAMKLSREDYRIRYCGAYLSQIRRAGRRVLIDGNATNQDELISIFNENRVEEVTLRSKILPIVQILPEIKMDKPAFEEVSEFRHELGIKKLDYLIAQNRQWENGVYFTHHKDVTIRLAEHLKCGMVIGGQTLKQREKTLQKAQIDCKVVVSLSAGGQGINGLGHFNDCFFIETSYSPATDEQAYMRLLRGKEIIKTIKVVWLISEHENAYLVNLKKMDLYKGVKCI